MRTKSKITKLKKEKGKLVSLPVLIEQDERGMYIGSVPSLRSCYTQAQTLDELYKNLQEVVELSIEVEKEFFGNKVETNRIVGFQNLSFALH